MFKSSFPLPCKWRFSHTTASMDTAVDPATKLNERPEKPNILKYARAPLRLGAAILQARKQLAICGPEERRKARIAGRKDEKDSSKIIEQRA